MKSNAVTVTNVNASDTWVPLLAPNEYRAGATIYNNASRVLRVAFAKPATSDNAVVVLAAQGADLPGGYFEVPYGFNGAIFGVWDADVSGKANVCEYR